MISGDIYHNLPRPCIISNNWALVRIWSTGTSLWTLYRHVDLIQRSQTITHICRIAWYAVIYKSDYNLYWCTSQHTWQVCLIMLIFVNNTTGQIVHSPLVHLTSAMLYYIITLLSQEAPDGEFVCDNSVPVKTVDLAWIAFCFSSPGWRFVSIHACIMTRLQYLLQWTPSIELYLIRD